MLWPSLIAWTCFIAWSVQASIWSPVSPVNAGFVRIWCVELLASFRPHTTLLCSSSQASSADAFSIAATNLMRRSYIGLSTMTIAPRSQIADGAFWVGPDPDAADPDVPDPDAKEPEAEVLAPAPPLAVGPELPIGVGAGVLSCPLPACP